MFMLAFFASGPAPKRNKAPAPALFKRPISSASFSFESSAPMVSSSVFSGAKPFFSINVSSMQAA